MSQRITEKEISKEILNTAHVLVTQPETDEDGYKTESLRRIPLSAFIKGINEIVIIEEQVISDLYDASGRYTKTVVGTFPAVVVGITYRVIWDGVEYTCECFGSASGGGINLDGILLGNPSMFADAFENTGEPFLLMPSTENFIIITNVEGSHILAVYQTGSSASGALTISDVVDNCKSRSAEDPLSANQGYLLQEQITTLSGKIEDLLYKQISITSFSNNVGTAEKGSTVDQLKLTWSFNKPPSALTLDGVAIETDLTAYTFSNLGLTATKAYRLAATDERGASATASTTVYFYNGVYYGVLTSGTEINSNAILSMTRKLQGSKALTFTVNAKESQRIVYALPSRYGTPNFNVGGFDGGFSKAGTILFKNASGYEENYDIWLSDNLGLGSTTVKVT